MKHFLIVIICFLMSSNCFAVNMATINSVAFQQWLDDQPNFFREVIIKGTLYQKATIFTHYECVADLKQKFNDYLNEDYSRCMEFWVAGNDAFFEKKNYPDAMAYFGALASWDKAIPEYYALMAMALSEMGQKGRAFLWDLKGAEKGYSKSLLQIGGAYLYGIPHIAPIDYKKAAVYLHEAFKKGDRTAGQLLLSLPEGYSPWPEQKR